MEYILISVLIISCIVFWGRYIWCRSCFEESKSEIVTLKCETQKAPDKIQHPSCFCSGCRTYGLRMLDSEFYKGNNYGIYFCENCERAFARPSDERVTMRGRYADSICKKYNGEIFIRKHPIRKRTRG